MHYDERLRDAGPYPKEKVMRIWRDEPDGMLHIILTSSGWDRFAVEAGHPDYDHYMAIFAVANPSGWVTMR